MPFSLGTCSTNQASRLRQYPRQLLPVLVAFVTWAKWRTAGLTGDATRVWLQSTRPSRNTVREWPCPEWPAPPLPLESDVPCTHACLPVPEWLQQSKPQCGAGVQFDLHEPGHCAPAIRASTAARRSRRLRAAMVSGIGGVAQQPPYVILPGSAVRHRLIVRATGV